MKIILTPEKASELLEKNKNNRKVRKYLVKRYLKTVESGNWLYTGEAIKVDTNDNVIDGQHRLLAVVESGESIEIELIEGIPPAAFNVIDSGSPRKLKDSLEALRIGNEWQLAQIIRWIHLVRTNFKKCHSFPNYLGLELYEELKDKLEFPAIAATHCIKLGYAGPIGALAFYVQDLNLKKGNEFFEALGSGIGLKKGSPILAMRNFIYGNKFKVTRLSREHFNLFAHVWNLHNEGKQVSSLRAFNRPSFLVTPK